jgi:hypothetical protein
MWRRREHQNADIAQLVEQVIRNDQVVGSSPTIGSSQNSFSWWRLKKRSKQANRRCDNGSDRCGESRVTQDG